MFKINGKIKLFAFDLDGTIYVGENLLPGAAALITYLKEKYKVIFFTNNSSKTRKEILQKLNRLGIDCALADIFTSSSAAAIYLKENRIGNIYVIGSKSFSRELKNKGCKIVDKKFAKNLVVGLDIDFNYDKIAAALSILSRGGKFIACNEDSFFPMGKKNFLPGCGAMVGAISAAVGKKPDCVVGKPNTYMLSKIAQAFRVKNNEIVVVGDSYESDCAMALNYKSKAVLIGRAKVVANKNIVTMGGLQELLQCIRREQ